jgi:hypothetical protein
MPGNIEARHRLVKPACAVGSLREQQPQDIVKSPAETEMSKELGMLNRIALVACLVLLPARSLPLGQGPTLTPEQRQAILGYELTLPRANQLITAMDAMTKYVVSLPDYKDRVVKSMKMTPAERLAQMEQDPKVMAILKQNGLTPREYLVGVPALRMALVAAQGGAGSAGMVASPANLAFAKANLSQLKPKMDAADGLRR